MEETYSSRRPVTAQSEIRSNYALLKPMWILAVLFRPTRVVFLAILAGLIVLGLIYGPWIAAQARAVGTLTTAYETPLLCWATRKLTDEPRLRDTTLVGTPVTIVQPNGDGPWHSILLINGATSGGRFDSQVVQLATGLARVGHRVAIIDAPDPDSNDLSLTAVEDTLRVARALARPDVSRDGELSLVGLGLGGTLALLVAEDRRLAERVPLVLAISPLTDLVELGRFVTTGAQSSELGFARLAVAPELLRTAANVLVEALPPGPTRDLLAGEISSALSNSAAGSNPTDASGNGAAVAPSNAGGVAGDPFAALDSIPEGLLGPESQAVVDLLANNDPEAYDALYQAMPGSVRRAVERLSPARNGRRLKARVELAVASSDPLVPFSQALALEQTVSNLKITVSDAFSSTESRPPLGSPGDFIRIDQLIVRALHAIRNG